MKPIGNELGSGSGFETMQPIDSREANANANANANQTKPEQTRVKIKWPLGCVWCIVGESSQWTRNTIGVYCAPPNDEPKPDELPSG